MKAIRILALALLGVAVASAASADNYALVVTGAAAGEPYAAKYTMWRRSFVSTLRTNFGYPDDHIIVLAEKPEASVRIATRAEVQRSLLELRGRLTKDDQLVVLLIGHGTIAEGPRGDDAKFNLAGPDLKASEWADLLKPLAARLVFVDTTAVSFPFLRQLAAPGRIIITSTDSAAQEFETLFGEFFVGSFEDAAADADKNGRVSIFEAFTYASAAVRTWYVQRGQLPTERALLDDDGDGVGHEAWNPAPDGPLARTVFLQSPATPADAGSVAAARRQRELESQIEELKQRRPTMRPGAYDAELERLLLELARVSASTRQPSR